MRSKPKLGDGSIRNPTRAWREFSDHRPGDRADFGSARPRGVAAVHGAGTEMVSHGSGGNGRASIPGARPRWVSDPVFGQHRPAASDYLSHEGTVLITTSRLILRPLELSDADPVQALFPQWEIVRFNLSGVRNPGLCGANVSRQ